MTSDPEEVVERVYAAWNKGDVDGMLALIHPDIEWRPGTDSPFAGVHSGLDGFERYTRSWADTFEHMHIDLGAIRTRGEWLMAELRQRSRPPGGSVDIDAVATHVWRVDEGKITKWFSFYDEAEAIAFLERKALADE